MSLRIAQEARPHSEGWWDWAVWLEGSQDELDKVEYVEYVLHPTFPNPVRKVTSRSNNFRLEARGWGEFDIKARVHLEDDGIEVLLKQDMDEQSLDALLETQRRSLIAGLFLVSNTRNPWLIRDYWMLEKSRITSLVVQIGELRDLPSEMQELPRFVIKDISETRMVAASIARRVQETL